MNMDALRATAMWCAGVCNGIFFCAAFIEMGAKPNPGNWHLLGFVALISTAVAIRLQRKAS